MSFDKSKFTRDPQLDAEGFVDYKAECHGCHTRDACPRSGHCPRYNSPLRHCLDEFDRLLAMGVSIAACTENFFRDGDYISHHDDPYWQDR